MRMDINYNTKNNKVTARHCTKRSANGPANLYYSDAQLYREMTYVNGGWTGIVKTTGRGQIQGRCILNGQRHRAERIDKNAAVKHRTIVVKEVDQLFVIQQISWRLPFGKNREVEFYKGELKDANIFIQKLPWFFPWRSGPYITVSKVVP